MGRSTGRNLRNRRRKQQIAKKLVRERKLQKKARRANGVTSSSASASSIWRGMKKWLETCQTVWACSSSARTRAGWQWPSTSTATPPRKS